MKARRAQRDQLQTVPGVGPNIAQDLRDLGVPSIAVLARRDPERLYRALNKRTGVIQDPCVLYTFRCAVYFARFKVRYIDPPVGEKGLTIFNSSPLTVMSRV